MGLATSYGGGLIQTERFFAGGGNSVRGYAEESLGPLGPHGTPAGGSALLMLSQEVRFPLSRRIAGVGFVDAGNVFASVRDISLRELWLGAGLGLRFDTLVGLLRVDYGLGLERTPGRSPDGAVRARGVRGGCATTTTGPGGSSRPSSCNAAPHVNHGNSEALSATAQPRVATSPPCGRA